MISDLSRSQTLTDEIGPVLAQLTHLSHLGLSSTWKLDGSFLIALRPPSHLVTLDLSHDQKIADASLVKLSCLTTLRDLSLAEIKVS